MLAVILTAVASTWGLILVLSLLEAANPVERQPLRARLFNLAYVPILILGIIAIVEPVSSWLTASTLAVARGGMLGRIFRPDHPIEQIGFALLFAFAWDLWRYGLHRLQHEVPLLWLSHRFHHSDEDVNATTHGRHHLSTFLLAEICYVPFLVVFGTLAPHFVVTLLLFRIWGYVVHLNLRLPFGAATRWIAGPQWHRIHHSVEAQHRDRNFATFFPVIDVIFGTYYEPRRDEYPRTGLAGESYSGDLREATIQPLADAVTLACKSVTATHRKALARHAPGLLAQNRNFTPAEMINGLTSSASLLGSPSPRAE